MLSRKQLAERAAIPLESVPTGSAEYHRIYRAQHATGTFKRRQSQRAMMSRKTRRKSD